MDFKSLKLFNLGSKDKIIKGTIGFTEHNMWMVDGVSKSNPRGKLNNKNLAYWWNAYLKENIEEQRDLLGLLNKGLILLKDTEFWGSELAVSLVIVREEEDTLKVLLIGDCEVVIGDNEIVAKQIKSNNYNITQTFISRMKEISEAENKEILETRADISEDLLKHIAGDTDEPYKLLRCKYNYITEREAVIEEIKKEKIMNITVYNSGVSRYYNTFGIGDIGDLYKKSIDKNYISIYDKISEKEKEDILCSKYPRIKPEKSCMLFSVGV